MRAALTCLPYYSHLAAVLPVAQAMRDAGHTVVVATASAMAKQVTEAGIDLLALPHVRTLAELMADPEFAGSPGMPRATWETAQERAVARTSPGRLTLARAGALAGASARDLLDAAVRFRPDIIVRECAEFGGYLAAQRLGLPDAVLDIAPLNAFHLPFVHESLNGERVKLGIEPVDDPWHPHGGTLIGLAPASWYPPALPIHPTRSYRSPESMSVLDHAFAELPGDRPLVLAGLGTIAPEIAPEAPAVLAAVITALGELPCTGVVAVGTESADWAGPRPGNVLTVPFVPLPSLLGGADLFVSQAGFGGTLAALRSATPMVSLPLLGDQKLNSHRIEELGCGLHVDPIGVEPSVLAGVCERVLTDGSFRYRAAQLSRHILAAPGYDVLAEDLAALC
ncbi:MAG TPA: glycosyltransferase [Pseudonocardiaceae bacterium]|jgi:N-glycosyltransferase